MRRQFQKKRPKSGGFYGSLFTIRETEDRERERERERERITPAWSRAPNQAVFLDLNRAQRLINQGRVSLTYPRDNSKGSRLSATKTSHPPELTRTPQELHHWKSSTTPEGPFCHFLCLPPVPREPMATFTLFLDSPRGSYLL